MDKASRTITFTDVNDRHLYTGSYDVIAGTESRICDESDPHGHQWHNVIHDKVQILENGRGGVPFAKYAYCEHGSRLSECSGAQHACTPEWRGVLHWLNHSKVADAWDDLLLEWYRKLYAFRPEQLPDMSVFLKELRDATGLIFLLGDYARTLRIYLKKNKQLSDAINDLDRDLWRIKRDPKRHTGEMLRIERDKLRLRKTLKDLANTRLSWQFGVKATVRDVTKIIASLYTYWDEMRFEPTREHVRRSVKLSESEEQTTSLTCGDPECTHYWRTVGDAVKVKQWDAEVTMSATTDFKNRLRGSSLEQVGYVLLSQMSAMPDIVSIWDMTRLSWLLDYFVRTNRLLLKVATAGGLGFQDPLIFRNSISLRVVEKFTARNANCPRDVDMWGDSEATWSHYERITNTSPLAITSLAKVLRMPGMNQGVNAGAVLLQYLL